MMQLSAASLAMHGSLIGDDSAFDCVGTDSRAVRPGQLFVALKGEHFDGHDYAKQALEQGAAGWYWKKIRLTYRRPSWLKTVIWLWVNWPRTGGQNLPYR